MAARTVNQIEYRARGEVRLREMRPATRTQIRLLEAMVVRLGTNHKLRKTIRSLNNAAKEILRTRDKTEIAVNNRTVAVTTVSRHLPRTSRMDKVGSAKLLLEIMDRAEIAAAISNKQTIIHPVNKTIRHDAKAARDSDK